MRITAAAVASAVLLVGAVAMSGCGSTKSSVESPTYPELRSALAGSPAPLAATHAEMGKVLPDGDRALSATIETLRGYPVVVNAWASWCGPCRYEFPIFGQASMKLGRKVGFLGLATRDSASSASSFLEKNPVGYPSWIDPSGKTASSLGVGAGLPATIFYDRSGRRSYIHQGPYSSLKALEDDIERYGNGP